VPPAIGDIPAAAQLQQQLDILNNAVTALGQGSPVTNLTVGIPPNPEDPTLLVMPIPIVLDPPITEQATIDNLMLSLTASAEAIEQQLVNMGYAPPVTSAAEIAEQARLALNDPRQQSEPTPGYPESPQPPEPPPPIVPPPQPEGNPSPAPI